jgi:hypothetical protein
LNVSDAAFQMRQFEIKAQYFLNAYRLSLNSQGNGLIRHVETCPDFLFTARVHTTKSMVKVLAANMHCKYFLKIAEHCQYSSLPDPWRNVHP